MSPRRVLLVVLGLAPVAVALAQVPPPAQPFGMPGAAGGFLPPGMPDPWRMPQAMPLAVPGKPRAKVPGYWEGDEFHAGTRPVKAAPVATGTHQGPPVDVGLDVTQQAKLLTDPAVTPSLRAATAWALRSADMEAARELAAKLALAHEVDPVDGIPSARTVPWHRAPPALPRLTAGMLAGQVLHELVAPEVRSPYERRLKGGDDRLFVVKNWVRFAEKRRAWPMERVRAEVSVAIDRYWQSGGRAQVLE